MVKSNTQELETGNWARYEKNWETPFPTGPTKIYCVSGNTDTSDSETSLGFTLVAEGKNFNTWKEVADNFHYRGDYLCLHNCDIDNMEEIPGVNPDDDDLLEDLSSLDLFKMMVSVKRLDPYFFVEETNPLAVWLTKVRKF